MTNQSTPPPGRTWLTVELDTDDLQTLAEVDIWDLDVIREEVGEEPEDKTDRLLAEAEGLFVHAASLSSFVGDIPPALRKMVEALRALRDERKSVT